MEKLSGSTKEIIKEKDIRNTDNLKYIPKLGHSFTPVTVTNCSAKTTSINEYSSAIQDISSLPALANVNSPESEEPPVYSTDGPDSAASATADGSGDGPRVSPPSEPLVECASCPCT